MAVSDRAQFSNLIRLYVFACMYLSTAVIYILGAITWLHIHHLILGGCSDDDVDAAESSTAACKVWHRMSEDRRLPQAMGIRMSAMSMIIFMACFLAMVLTRRQLTQRICDLCAVVFAAGGCLHLLQEIVWSTYWEDLRIGEDTAPTFLMCASSVLMLFTTVSYKCSNEHAIHHDE